MNKFLTMCCVAVVSAMSASAQTAAPLKVNDVFTPLPAGSIKLSGYFENDIQNNITHWNKGVLPYGKLVDFFRSGRPQFALGEMWGKAVRSGAMYYRYTHDSELKRILHATVEDLLTTTRSNGSISCDPVEKQPDVNGGDMWERKYVLLGLHEYYTQVEADPAVLEAMKREALNIIDLVGEAPKTDINTLGWSANKIESSSLLEPFMRLYKMTADKCFLDFATYIVNHGGCQGSNIFQQAIDNVLPRQMALPYPKAYEMMSVFEGLTEYYRVTGDPKWKTSFMNLFHNVIDREITIVGNAGGDQPYFPDWAGEAWDDTKFEQTNPNIKRMMETCIGITWEKLCSQILRITGTPLAVDYIEKYIYNGLLGAMKPSGDGFSYVNLLNGEKVTNQGWGWNFDGLPVTCCNLNGPMGLAYIPFVAVMQSKQGPVVNLYNAAQATASSPKGNPVKLDIATKFPLSNVATITVNPAKTESFTIKLHMPLWSENTIVKVNGKAMANVVAGQYLNLKRKWKRADKIEVTFDMKCRLIDAPTQGSNPAGRYFQAVQYGPIVLARDENTDPSFDKPVQVVADANGIVAVKRVAPTLKGTRMEFEVPTTDGPIRMIDFSSVNCWNGKKICTWLPMKR